MTINVFISYSHKDEAFREQLATHLVPLQRVKDVELWYDGDMLAGVALTPEIRRKLKQSDILVALASHHYLASDYCFDKEYSSAMRRVSKGTMHVVAVLLSPCDWRSTRMANYKLLPKDGKPVEQWGNRNLAYVDIVAGIRRVVAAVRAEKKAAEASAEKATPKPSSKAGRKPRGQATTAKAAKPATGAKPLAGGRPKAKVAPASRRKPAERATPAPVGSKAGRPAPKGPRKRPL